MQKMRIIIDNFDTNIGNFALWSTFYIQLGSNFFPCEGWTDATSSILSMWLEDVQKFLSGNYTSVPLHFMDGDYAIELNWHDRSQATITFIAKGQITLEAEPIDLPHFVRQLLAACSKLIHHYNSHKYLPQIQEVSELSKKLKSYLEIICADTQGD